MALTVRLVSPERVLFTGEATFVTARTEGGGDITFLTGHTSFIGALGTHPVTIRLAEGETGAASLPGEDLVVAVHGGFVEVADDIVTILSDLAELAADIDAERARAALSAAESAVRDDPDDAKAQAAHARATVRVTVADG